MKYYIENSKGLWWSNTDGWCDNTRSLFTQEKRDTFNLPMGEGVEWKELNDETIQEQQRSVGRNTSCRT